MTNLNISMPESLRAFVEAQVAEGGYSTASEYVRSLIRDAQKRAAQQELEAKLLEGLRSQAGEMTVEDWQRMRAAIREQHGGGDSV